jgi:hypothetical protein
MCPCQESSSHVPLDSRHVIAPPLILLCMFHVYVNPLYITRVEDTHASLLFWFVNAGPAQAQ